MKNFKFYFFNFTLLIALFLIPSISSAQFDSGLGADDDTNQYEGEITCHLWEPNSDVWFANGCHLLVSDPNTGGTGGGNNTGNTGGTGGGVPTNPPSSSSGCSLYTNGTKTTFSTLIAYIVCIINTSIIPFVFGLALVAFLYGVVRYVLNTENENEREKGKQFMIWGVVALTVMVAIWGIVAIFGNTFGFESSVIPQVSP